MPKRSSGEGSIFQRSDGRWAAAVTVAWNGGRQRRKYLYGRTQEEVRDKLISTRAAQLQGVDIAPERLTVATWLGRWLENQKPPAVRPKTYTFYEYQVREHLAPDLGTRLLSKLQPQDVRDFMRAKANGGLSTKTIRHLRATLRAALNVALHDGLITRNVAALAKPPRLQKHPMQVFTAEDARAFLTAVKGHRLEALFTVTLALGLREGEILGLGIKDIDLEAGKLHVRFALQRVRQPGEKKGHLILVEPKTEGSRRTINLPQIAVSALSAHLARRDEEKLLCGSKWKESGLVFTTSIGTPMDQKKLHNAFVEVLDCAELPRIRFHDLRHSAATLLLAQGVHPRFVTELFGHSSISLTMNTYSHVLESMKRETANQMEAILNPVAVNVTVKPKKKGRSGRKLMKYIWRARRDSNPRPTGSKPVALSG